MAATRELATTQLPKPVTLADAAGLPLMLPIFEQQVTAIGYYPVDDDDVVALTPRGHQANGSIISRGLGQMFSQGEEFEYVVMEADDRYGPATKSMDVGAPAGTLVYAPVDGVIAGIRTYQLKGQCPDVEVKIQPQSHSKMLVVLTHLDQIEAELGQPVRAGVSRIGSVRRLDACVEQQLGRYTYDSGNHLHLQVETSIAGRR